jgi:hypothetical protein
MPPKLIPKPARAPRRQKTIHIAPTDAPLVEPRIQNEKKLDTGITFQVKTFPYLDQLPLEELRNALEADDTNRARRFLADLNNPLLRSYTVATLAHKNGISIPDLHAVWRNYKTAESLFRAQESGPTVATHTAEDAKSQWITCTRCDGAGQIQVARRSGQEWIDCGTCQGTGAQRRPGDKASRQWILEAVGVIKPKAGVVINQSIHSTASVESVLDELEHLPPAIDVTHS